MGVRYTKHTPNKLSKFIVKRKAYCLYSTKLEYKIQGLKDDRDANCADYCLYTIHLTKVSGMDFKSVVSNLYHQTIS